MSELIIPTLKLSPGKLTARGRDWLSPVVDFEQVDWITRIREKTGKLPPVAGGSGSFSNFLSPLVLAHMTGQDNVSWAAITPVYFCLLTTVPDSSKVLGALPSNGTGSNVAEATFTSYARYSMAHGAWAAASAGAAGVASSIANTGAFTMAGCTGSSSTVIAWCLGDQASLGGDVLAWGSATSVVISTTQTPPAVASGAISLTLL